MSNNPSLQCVYLRLSCTFVISSIVQFEYFTYITFWLYIQISTLTHHTKVQNIKIKTTKHNKTRMHCFVTVFFWLDTFVLRFLSCSWIKWFLCLRKFAIDRHAVSLLTTVISFRAVWNIDTAMNILLKRM